MRLTNLVVILLAFLVMSCSQPPTRQISVEDYIDKMKAGWIGQMAGVGWGAPTEFKYNGLIIPESKVPEWTPEMINQFYQDDIYVEMTFLRTLEQHGWDVSIRQAGIDFANSQYRLWHANRAGRGNLRSGIAPPYSGHPQYNSHADDIDYQIEADYAGLISPGLPQATIDLGEKFGRLMNYGDGLYGGQFVAAMYAEAFFESDMEKLIEAGLETIPEKSMYAEAIRDVVNWYHETPDDWQAAWEKIEAKYQDNPEYRKFSCTGADADFNIDAKINGAYIVMGMLYGEGDLDKTIKISMRCGQDSDCNPSNAAGILATTLGFENLPEKYTSALVTDIKFSYTDYNFSELVAVCEKLARQAVQRYGGSVEKEGGEEVFVLPVKTPEPSELEQCWEPEPVPENVKFTGEEMQQIQIKERPAEAFIQQWKIAGPFIQTGIDGEHLFDVRFAPEQNIQNVEWKEITLGKDGLPPKIVPLLDIYGGQARVAYLYTTVISDDTQAAVLELGSDDGVKVWLNDELVYALNVARACTPGEDRISVMLKEGENELLVKVTQRDGGWEVSVLPADENGKPLNKLNNQL